MRMVGWLVGIGTAGALATLTGCAENSVASRGTFKADYLVARGALESGRYGEAIRDYRRLLPTAGPLEGRLRLEYAHSLLRDDRFADAAAQARMLAGAETGTARATALAVEGTAEHELALAALKDKPGDTAAIRAHLLAAQAAFGEALDDPADLDPLGVLAIRKHNIETMLAARG